MTPFERYLAPARTGTSIWRLPAGLLMVAGMWIAAMVVVIGIWFAVLIDRTGNIDAALAELQQTLKGGDHPRIAVLLLTFSGIWFGVWAAVVAFHRQTLRTVLTPVGWVSWPDFWRGMALAGVIGGAALVVAHTFAEPRRSDVDLGVWAIWLIPFFVLIFVQAAGEELIFRGYLVQQLAQRWRHPVVWAVIPSFLFGLAHLDTKLPDHGGLRYVAVTFLMGLTFAVLVWRSGNLWSAIGLHYGNNLFGLLLLGTDGLLSGTQIWLFDRSAQSGVFNADLVMVTVLLALVVSPLGRIFGRGGGHAAATAVTAGRAPGVDGETMR